MNELLRHLHKDHLPSLYWDEISQRIEYSELIGFVYMMIRRALNEGADSLQVSGWSLEWSREGNVIGKVAHSQIFRYSKYPPENYAKQMQKIIAKDSIVQEWIRIVGDVGDSIACDFLSHP